MQAALGKVFGTAPTNVATDNLASRLDLISRKVTDRLNAKRDKDNTGFRRLLVVRAFKLDDEHAAFINILRDPTLRDNAAPQHKWGPESKWTLHLSRAYWLLMCLGSTVVRYIHEDDSYYLHRYVKSRIENSPLCTRLREVARQEISWQEYESGAMIEKAIIKDMFLTILEYADILCTTPALACRDGFGDWREEKSQTIIVDEEGNMCRPDLYFVWGNALSPCLLVDDDKQQLRPAVGESRDGRGQRHSNGGIKIAEATLLL